MNLPPSLASSTETGSLGATHLKRLWSSMQAQRAGQAQQRIAEEQLDLMLLNALGLNYHQTVQYLYFNGPTFAEFEHWIIKIAGKPDPLNVARLNAKIGGTAYPPPVCDWLKSVDQQEPVLSQQDLDFWEQNGYVILRNAVSERDRIKAERAIWEYVGAHPNKPDSWYVKNRHGIMVELTQHPALEKNRCSRRIRKAFAQLWQKSDLWVTTDRCGFHPPQDENHPFPGPDLHWDIDFDLPLAFGTQGILYLSDTPHGQGALTLVPGFQHRLSDWLQNLKPDADPQQQDLHALGSIPVGGKAGDMVIWHHHLPHGSRPNLGNAPRIVQYINMHPGWSPRV